MNANIPVLFRSYSSQETHSGCKIWEAARATSAVPTFFKRIEIGNKQPFIDGGLGCNNPSKLLLKEAKVVFPTHPIGCLVSIGTGQAEVISIRTSGFFQQIVPTDVIDALKAISIDCEAIHEEMSLLFGNSPDIYFRINVEQGMQGIKLSEWEKMANVEAHTMQYLRREEVGKKLTLTIKAIKFPKAQLMMEQFGMKQFIL
jgi:patatin-like phospholipase/acyl hydrolase